MIIEQYSFEDRFFTLIVPFEELETYFCQQIRNNPKDKKSLREKILDSPLADHIKENLIHNLDNWKPNELVFSIIKRQRPQNFKEE